MGREERVLWIELFWGTVEELARGASEAATGSCVILADTARLGSSWTNSGNGGGGGRHIIT